MLLFNLYLNSGSVLAAFSSSRYFYFPSLAFSLFWGSILASIFSKGRLTPKILIPLFSVLWMAYNNIAVQRYLAIDGLKHRINKQIIQTVRAWAPDLKRQPSYLLIPSAIGSYGAEFVYRYYSHPEGKVALVHQEGPDFNKLVEQTAPDRLYVLQLDLTTDVLVDETEGSRVLLKKLKER